MSILVNYDEIMEFNPNMFLRSYFNFKENLKKRITISKVDLNAVRCELVQHTIQKDGVVVKIGGVHQQIDSAVKITEDDVQDYSSDGVDLDLLLSDYMSEVIILEKCIRKLIILYIKLVEDIDILSFSKSCIDYSILFPKFQKNI